MNHSHRIKQNLQVRCARAESDASANLNTQASTGGQFEETGLLLHVTEGNPVARLRVSQCGPGPGSSDRDSESDSDAA